MASSKLTEKLSSLSVRTAKSNTSFDYAATAPRSHRKVSSFVISKYLPIYQSTVQKNITGSSSGRLKTDSAVLNNSSLKKDASVQCSLLQYRFDLSQASCLTISQNAIFPVFYVRRINNNQLGLTNNCLASHRKSSNLSSQCQNNGQRLTTTVNESREIGVQTYTPSGYVDQEPGCLIAYDLDETSKTGKEKLTEDLAYAFKQKKSFHKIVRVFDELNEESLKFINKIVEQETGVEARHAVFQTLTSLNNCETFNSLLLNLSEPEKNASFYTISFLNKLVRLANSGNGKRRIKGVVRFEEIEGDCGDQDEEAKQRRRLVLARFRRAVKFVILNRGWLKTSHKEKMDEYDRFFSNEEYSYAASSLNNKKIQLLFNKNEFKAQRNLTSSLITDLHRQILSKEPGTRDKYETEFLANLVCTIPRLTAFPKYVCLHVAQMIKFLTYEKGREVIREGHRAVGFYFVMSGGCDVLSLGRDGLLKIDELQSGDTFGESSFQITDHSNSNKIHNHTVITSHDLTELLTIEPVEIENYLASMRVVEQRLIDTFIRKWWPVSSWCWSEVEFEKFSAAAEFIRFNKYDVVHANAADSTASQLLPASALWQFQLERNVYFVIKGKLEMILLLRSEDKTALRVSYLDTNDYFGYFETDLVVRACEDDCELIKISKQAFLSIHSNSSYILSKLIDDYKINTPRGHQVLEFYNERLRVLKSLKRLEEEKKKSHSGSSKSSPTFRS